MTDDADKIEGVALEMIELFGEGAARIVRQHAGDAATRGDSPFAHVLCDIAEVIERSMDFQRSNTGRIVFRGSYDVPAFPAPHPGEAPPPDEPAEGVLDPPPCGYRLTDEQLRSQQDGSRSAADRLAAHGIKIQQRGPRGWFVPMKQELRGLVPLLLDGEAAEPMVAGQRVGC